MMIMTRLVLVLAIATSSLLVLCAGDRAPTTIRDAVAEVPDISVAAATHHKHRREEKNPVVTLPATAAASPSQRQPLHLPTTVLKGNEAPQMAGQHQNGRNGNVKEKAMVTPLVGQSSSSEGSDAGQTSHGGHDTPHDDDDDGPSIGGIVAVCIMALLFLGVGIMIAYYRRIHSHDGGEYTQITGCE